jgi:N-methylhydantoinase B
MHTWAYVNEQGHVEGWLSLDGAMTGGGAGRDRDGNDFANFMVAKKAIIEAIDVEMFEAIYPALVIEKRPRAGTFGAGAFRSGAGSQMTCRPYGTNQWVGALLGMRERLPLPGVSGGYPGATTRFEITRADGSRVQPSGHANGLVVEEGEAFTFYCASSGGWGDPLQRDPDMVGADVRQDRLTVDDARAAYGVVVDRRGTVDRSATAAARSALLAQRLQDASPAATPLAADALAPLRGPGRPLYPGVVQAGNVAYAAASGVPLAIAPDPWTDGCPVLEQHLNDAVVLRAYLDPATGQTLMVDVMPVGEARTVDCRPDRWTTATTDSRVGLP